MPAYTIPSVHSSFYPELSCQPDKWIIFIPYKDGKYHARVSSMNFTLEGKLIDCVAIGHGGGREGCRSQMRVHEAKMLKSKIILKSIFLMLGSYLRRSIFYPKSLSFDNILRGKMSQFEGEVSCLEGKLPLYETLHAAVWQV